MIKEKKSAFKKLLAGVLLPVLAFAMMCLPVFTQTVKAEETVDLSIYYYYVNTSGYSSYYEDTLSVSGDMTWNEVNEICESNAATLFADANEDNVWEASGNGCWESDQVQESTIRYQHVYGYPSTYKPACFSVYYNGAMVRSLLTFLIPTEYAYGSEEAFAYVESNLSMYTTGTYSIIAELYNREGVSVTVEGEREGTEYLWEAYRVNITGPDSSSAEAEESADTSSDEESADTSSDEESTDTSSDAGSSYAEASEITYTSETGETLRRIVASGNGTVALDGALAYLPAGAVFTSAQVTSGDTYDLVAGLVSQKVSGATGFAVFDMNLTDASNVALHQLDGYINVTLPIPEGLSASDGKTLVVYRIEDDGTWTKCNTATANGYLTFATNHFSTYVIVETSGTTALTSPKTGEETMAYAWAVMLLAAGGCVYFGRRKHSAAN